MPPRRAPVRALVLFAALWAVLWAGLVPNGYMPGPTAEGGWSLILCPDSGAPVRAAAHSARQAASHQAHGADEHARHSRHAGPPSAIAAHGGDHAQHAGVLSPAPEGLDPSTPPQADGPRCTWAAAADPALSAPQLALTAASWTYPPQPARPARLDLAPGRGLAAPPPPSHGPPI